jgi:crotonobetainyl-CoA:carnitine CoA-transferase CaiB-like acyl-CoA transferase
LKPLEGVRVLDLTRLLPGAYATLLLADLGADVIKIEAPRGGDHMRQMPPLAGGTSVFFHLLNRNKRSVALDLRAPEAASVLDALAARSDVVVDSFRPRTAKRLGVDAAALRARHPRLICASITGFGQTGPYVDRAAHDINYEALVGLLTTRDRPRIPDLLVGDIGAAMNAAAGILAALFQRERSGRGAAVDASIHEAALAWLMFPAARGLVAGGFEDPNEVPLTGENACYNIYETADGRFLALGALEPKFWTGFCERIGRPEFVALQHARGGERVRVLDDVRAVMRKRTCDEWLVIFADADVCLTRVNTVDEMLADPHIEARQAVSHDRGTTHIATPITITDDADPEAWDAARGIAVRPAPALGADTDHILEEVGIDADRRAALRRTGVI